MPFTRTPLYYIIVCVGCSVVRATRPASRPRSGAPGSDGAQPLRVCQNHLPSTDPLGLHQKHPTTGTGNMGMGWIDILFSPREGVSVCSLLQFSSLLSL